MCLMERICQQGMKLVECFQYLHRPGKRDPHVTQICELYEDWMRHFDSLEQSTEKGITSYVACLPTILNLSLTCPHDIVRLPMRALFEKIRLWGKVDMPAAVHEGCSFFIPESEIHPIDTSDPEVQEELREAFDCDGRVSHMTRLMCFHPGFLKRFRETYNNLLLGNGPLQQKQRHLIAVMGASRHSCQYLVDIQTRLFLNQGGDERWLDGPHMLPPKERMLVEVSMMLAHKPWSFTAEHVKKLVQAHPEAQNCWSLAELVQAILILARFHTMPTIVFGCGCTEEVDIRNTLSDDAALSPPSSLTPIGSPSRGSPTKQTKIPVPESTDGAEPEPDTEPLPLPPDGIMTIKHVLARITRIQTRPVQASITADSARLDSSSVGTTSSSTPGSAGFPASPASASSRSALHTASPSASISAGTFSTNSMAAALPNSATHPLSLAGGPSVSATSSSSASAAAATSSQAVGSAISSLVYGFGPSSDAEYESFNPAKHDPFLVQNFSWEDQGYEALQPFSDSLTSNLSDEFKCIRSLTYDRMGDVEGVDTFKFRLAVWNYVFSLYGVTDQEFLFAEVEELVQGSLREWVKLLACFPQRASARRYNAFMDLQHSEKVHVCLLVMEARFMVEILYGLRALSDYMKQPK